MRRKRQIFFPSMKGVSNNVKEKSRSEERISNSSKTSNAYSYANSVKTLPKNQEKNIHYSPFEQQFNRVVEKINGYSVILGLFGVNYDFEMNQVLQREEGNSDICICPIRYNNGGNIYRNIILGLYNYVNSFVNDPFENNTEIKFFNDLALDAERKLLNATDFTFGNYYFQCENIIRMYDIIQSEIFQNAKIIFFIDIKDSCLEYRMLSMLEKIKFRNVIFVIGGILNIDMQIKALNSRYGNGMEIVTKFFGYGLQNVFSI